MPPPAQPKIYHIVHVDKLSSIIGEGALLCDSSVINRKLGGTTIGMGSIKQRRLGLPVHCHPGLNVGDFVPFYFCSRSIMLYVIYKANHPELAYQGGQAPIMHLEADLGTVVDWANKHGRRWAFSTINAANAAAEFRKNLGQLGEINWDAVAEQKWTACRDEKQAEFLLHESFPWELVERIGVCSRQTYDQVLGGLNGAAHRPKVELKPDWYY
ncbi:MAG: DUF4433 domain-containing protein [Ferrovibrio sp.]|uniref:type II toxin-antitoxin system toxin DNA ADP-ribosyl transferase DarT n=1 Tax=Ferrovibrio sp. TaxID=1917215 RepID=UPI00391DD508